MVLFHLITFSHMTLFGLAVCFCDLHLVSVPCLSPKSRLFALLDTRSYTRHKRRADHFEIIAFTQNYYQSCTLRHPLHYCKLTIFHQISVLNLNTQIPLFAFFANRSCTSHKRHAIHHEITNFTQNNYQLCTLRHVLPIVVQVNNYFPNTMDKPTLGHLSLT